MDCVCVPFRGGVGASPFGCAVAEIFVGYTRPCLKMVSWWLKTSGVGAVLWQSGWGYILPVLPCQGVSLDGDTVSPDPSCLSLQYLCCSRLCVGGLGSVCYIWSTSVLSGVLCEFKYALCNSLFPSLSLGGPEP
jgi:hypothetical protein